MMEEVVDESWGPLTSEAIQAQCVRFTPSDVSLTLQARNFTKDRMDPTSLVPIPLPRRIRPLQLCATTNLGSLLHTSRQSAKAELVNTALFKSTLESAAMRCGGSMRGRLSWEGSEQGYGRLLRLRSKSILLMIRIHSS